MHRSTNLPEVFVIWQTVLHNPSVAFGDSSPYTGEPLDGAVPKTSEPFNP